MQARNLGLLVAALTATAAAGCGGGGGGSARYSKPALVACLHEHGTPTQDISNPITASDKQVSALLKPIAPNMIVAKFPSGEFVGIAFASGSAGATRILHKFQQLARRPGATPGRLTQKGSMVVLTSPHVTAGVDDTLSKCEASALIK